MSKKWIREVEAEQIKDDSQYFIAIRPASRMTSHLFSARGLNGKTCWSEKPGIARRYQGSEELRKYMKQRNDLVAVLIPPDANTRWRARKEKR